MTDAVYKDHKTLRCSIEQKIKCSNCKFIAFTDMPKEKP